MINLTIKVPSSADVDVIDVIVKIVDHLREDTDYSESIRDEGIKHAEGLIRALKSKIGHRTIVGLGRVGG